MSFLLTAHNQSRNLKRCFTLQMAADFKQIDETPLVGICRIFDILQGKAIALEPIPRLQEYVLAPVLAGGYQVYPGTSLVVGEQLPLRIGQVAVEFYAIRLTVGMKAARKTIGRGRS